MDDPVTSVNKAVTGIGRGIGDIGDYIRQQRNNAQISVRQLAKLAGVSNPYLSQVERGLRRPSAEILQQIAKGLRISAEALYVHAGILDEKDSGPVVDAIRADRDLSERQKQTLLDVYESFRRQNRSEHDEPARPGADGSSHAPTPQSTSEQPHLTQE